jgi:WhiB family transcriptional regulator, redox-sensing transcriptional regulator
MAYQTRTASGLDTPRGEDWQKRAACRDEDPDTFFSSDHTEWRVERALSVCAGCPVTGQCLDRALAIHKSPSELYGVWAGRSQAQMRMLLADHIEQRYAAAAQTCRRCGEIGLTLDGRRLCIDCFYIARRGRYLGRFYNADPDRVHEPRPDGDVANRLPMKCGFGHDYTPVNTYISPDGKRTCRRCKNGRRTFRAKERVSS